MIEKGINITYEVELARRSNFKYLFDKLKQVELEKRIHDTSLFVDMLSGTIDKEVSENIDRMLKNGEIDGMYQYVY